MLADYLLADKELLRTYDGLGSVYRRIALAQKFILSKDFAVAADGLVDNTPELRKVVPYCRLPYPRMWIEWTHDDRPHWDQRGPYKARPVDKSRHQSEPSRCAFLLEQIGDFPGRWKAHLFWSLKEIPEGCATDLNGSLAALLVDASSEIAHSPDPFAEALSKVIMADFGQGLLNKLPDHLAMRLVEYAQEDWGGEFRFMIAVLGLINCRNVTHYEFVDKEQHNIKRKKQGKLPLFSHKLLKIRPSMIRASSTGAVGHEHRDLRLHFVSGHFKTRKTGIFWWNHYARGSVRKGFVDKDYEL